jgi:phosphatidylglycerophosphate synthase
MFRGIYGLKPYKDRKLHAFANWLAIHGVSANMITLTGLVFGLSAAACLLFRQSLWGLTFILLSVFADMLDGTVARLNQQATLTGRKFDSACDRIVETTCVGALICSGIIPWWGGLLPLGSIMLLVTRTWAYRYGLDTSFVITARFERIAAIVIIVLFSWNWVTMVFLLLVVIGTLLSNLMIIKEIFRKRSAGFYAKRNACGAKKL